MRSCLGLMVALIFFASGHSQAQGHQQLWIDYQIDYPFANKYLVEVSANYQTVLTNEFKWRSFGMTPTFEYVTLPWLDLTADLPFAYTVQKADTNSFEAAPMVSARWHLRQNRKVNARLLLRYQNRYFHEIEKDKWDIVNRMRLRGEMSIAINGPNLYVDKLWYSFLDYEEFFVIDEQVKERYANRRRARIGIGYRLDYRNRFEMSYTWQSSRNEIEGAFISNDRVLQLVYKMYLNPPKEASAK